MVMIENVINKIFFQANAVKDDYFEQSMECYCYSIQMKYYKIH